ncbi:MAG: hypothetical protein ABH816_04145 [Candidatus Levyibacteriota bacterium]
MANPREEEKPVQPSLVYQMKATISGGLQNLEMLPVGEIVDPKFIYFPMLIIDEDASEILGDKKIPLVVVKFPKSNYQGELFDLSTEHNIWEDEERLRLYCYSNSNTLVIDLQLPKLVDDDGYQASFDRDDVYGENPNVIMIPGTIGAPEDILLVALDGERIGCTTVFFPENWRKAVKNGGLDEETPTADDFAPLNFFAGITETPPTCAKMIEPTREETPKPKKSETLRDFVARLQDGESFPLFNVPGIVVEEGTRVAVLGKNPGTDIRFVNNDNFVRLTFYDLNLETVWELSKKDALKPDDLLSCFERNNQRQGQLIIEIKKTEEGIS